MGTASASLFGFVRLLLVTKVDRLEVHDGDSKCESL
jgi:hypothetical protein